MKDYKKVNISEVKTYEESSLCSCSLLKVLIILISIIIITSVICIYFYYENNTDDKIYIQVENNSKNTILGTDKYNEIKSYEKSLREITKSEMAEFRQINNKGLLYDRTKYPLSETPDVSIITTIYNQAHCIFEVCKINR